MKKIILWKNLSLPLTSGVEIFFWCTSFEFGFFCLQELLYIWYEKQQKYSKSDDFARVCAIINHDLFWCQKPSKTNLRMTLGLIFNHLFWKHHFGAFPVFYTKYSSIFGDKKIQTQKWCIVEKFRPQKLGVTKGFFILKVVSDFDFDHFLEKWSQRHLVGVLSGKKFSSGSTQ